MWQGNRLKTLGICQRTVYFCTLRAIDAEESRGKKDQSVCGRDQAKAIREEAPPQAPIKGNHRSPPSLEMHGPPSSAKKDYKKFSQAMRTPHSVSWKVQNRWPTISYSSNERVTADVNESDRPLRFQTSQVDS